MQKRVRASMGPRPIGRGNSPKPGRRAVQLVRFNGAATDRSRKFKFSRATETWWIASMGPRPIGRGNSPPPPPRARKRFFSFNGAATDRSRKFEYRDLYELFGKASMGPRPIGRGNLAPHNPNKRKTAASMGPRPIGRGNAVDGPCRDWIPAGFNGAATDRSRKFRWISQMCTIGYLLQWGRDRSVAEIL